jgi:hypothetical protein
MRGEENFKNKKIKILKKFPNFPLLGPRTFHIIFIARAFKLQNTLSPEALRVRVL